MINQLPYTTPYWSPYFKTPGSGQVTVQLGRFYSYNGHLLSNSRTSWTVNLHLAPTQVTRTNPKFEFPTSHKYKFPRRTWTQSVARWYFSKFTICPSLWFVFECREKGSCCFVYIILEAECFSPVVTLCILKTQDSYGIAFGLWPEDKATQCNTATQARLWCALSLQLKSIALGMRKQQQSFIWKPTPSERWRCVPNYIPVQIL